MSLSHRVVLIMKLLCLVKSDRERQIFYVLSYMWNPKNKTNVYNKTETDSQSQRTN